VQAAAVDPRIEAVVGEGTFRNLKEVMYDYAGFQRCVFLGKTFFCPAVMVADLEAEREGGFRFEDVSPENSAAMRKFPILLIYGLSDHKIPLRHSEAIFQAAIGPKQLWLVPGATHTRTFQTAPAEFQRRVLDLFATTAAGR
jgi:pimeloyl-ACP methyl ester carboxylesterase